jgi:hypothetical protein
MWQAIFLGDFHVNLCIDFEKKFKVFADHRKSSAKVVAEPTASNGFAGINTVVLRTLQLSFGLKEVFVAFQFPVAKLVSQFLNHVSPPPPLRGWVGQ